jgi:hypothetical protein
LAAVLLAWVGPFCFAPPFQTLKQRQDVVGWIQRMQGLYFRYGALVPLVEGFEEIGGLGSREGLEVWN